MLLRPEEPSSVSARHHEPLTADWGDLPGTSGEINQKRAEVTQLFHRMTVVIIPDLIDMFKPKVLFAFILYYHISES